MTTNLHDKMLAAIDAYFSASRLAERDQAEEQLLDVRDEIRKQPAQPLTDIYRSFEQWKNGNVLEHDVPRTKYYSEAQLDLVEMGWKYGYDAGLAEQPAQQEPVADKHQAFIDSLPSDMEDKMFEQIHYWARQSYARHQRSTRGQMITAADSSDNHIIWAALRWAKENAATPPAQPPAQPLTDEMVTAAARALNKRQAEACGVDKNDHWTFYGDDIKEDARAVLEAALGITKGNT